MCSFINIYKGHLFKGDITNKSTHRKEHVSHLCLGIRKLSLSCLFLASYRIFPFTQIFSQFLVIGCLESLNYFLRTTMSGSIFQNVSGFEEHHSSSTCHLIVDSQEACRHFSVQCLFFSISFHLRELGKLSYLAFYALLCNGTFKWVMQAGVFFSF